MHEFSLPFPCFSACWWSHGSIPFERFLLFIGLSEILSIPNTLALSFYHLSLKMRSFRVLRIKPLHVVHRRLQIVHLNGTSWLSSMRDLKSKRKPNAYM
jgi:hypothetical protein